ncbi:MAG: mammalian cell entry protein, partial [Chitinophagaceae bacterium]|nr:mammalian cell entry protein [Chitinophagaceae bacterium]
NLTTASTQLNELLDTQKGSLSKTLGNLNDFTGNLKNNNDTITTIFSNLKGLTGNLAELDLKNTLTQLDGAVGQLNHTLQKINNSEGTLGLLVNDKKLYSNLNSTANSLNLLLQDFRIQPRRYTGGIVFGKKDKSPPLMTPLPDTLSTPPVMNKKRK